MNTVRAAQVRVMPPATDAFDLGNTLPVKEGGGMNTVRAAQARVMPPATGASNFVKVAA